MTEDVPRSVACPCGNGYADHRRETVSKPNKKFRRRIVHHYRHEGCPVGGHIVTRSGHPVSKGGPLFRGQRNEFGRFTSAIEDRLVADGGSKQ